MTTAFTPQDLPVQILIADDNHTDRLLLKTILSKQGHDVLVAEDGVEAVEMFAATRPAIVLLDLLMPRMDGYEAARRIKQLAGESMVPIIFLTSLQQPGELAAALAAGGDDFLSKPYNSVILQAKISAFARMRQMHIETLRQRDTIAEHNQHMLREQQVAKRVFDRIAHSGCLDAPNIRYVISPIAIFNGDVMLCGVGPAGKLVTFLGDFTGHGLNAAIGAMPLAQIFYSMLEKGFSPRDIMREVNSRLHEILPVDIFCCGVITELDFQAGKLQVWNAGMPDCVLYRCQSGQLEWLPSRHVPLGVMPKVQFNRSVDTYEVSEGDRLLLWSDGIMEAANTAGEMFGQQRLQAVIEASPCAAIFDHIMSAVNDFVGTAAASDDISLLCIEVVSKQRFHVQQGMHHQEQAAGPGNWQMTYCMRDETLKDFEPTPLLLYVLMQVPYLRLHSTPIYTILTELYVNALEHGILGLNSALKDSPAGFSRYYELKRQALQQLQRGSIEITLDYCGTHSGGLLRITMVDSGPGFDYRGNRFGIGSAPSEQALAGRGIELVAALCDDLRYEGNGNTVVAEYRWQHGDKLLS